MFNTRSELLEKIRLGEDGLLELKEVRLAGDKIRGPSQADLADELAAFANSSGGVLVLGGEDQSRDVIGIPLKRLDDVEALLRQACEDAIKPPLAPMIERMTLPDITGAEQPVIRVAVARSLFVHLSPGGYMQRVGSAKRAIPPDQLARLFQQRSQSRLIRFDETPVSNAELNDLDESLLQRYIPANSTQDTEVVLGKLAMVAKDDQGVIRPTVAGLLMASRHPERFLPGAFVQAVAYRGNDVLPGADGAYQQDALDITGPLDQQVIQACSFVRRNMKVAATKHESGGREDKPQYAMLAVFEALVNAVAHRDYSMAGSKIRLRMFADRLEIYSPGMLPNTMSPESLAYRQAARNEAITSLLARCPVDVDSFEHRKFMMDKRGEGVPIILDASKQLSGQQPVYQVIDQSELKLTIFGMQVEPTE